MRFACASLAVVAIAFALAGCYSPTHAGDGEMDVLTVGSDLEPGRLHLLSDGETLLVETRGPAPVRVLEYDAKLARRGSANHSGVGLAVARDEAAALVLEDDRVSFRTAPGLKSITEVGEPEGALFDSETRILAWPEGGGYTFLTSKPGRPNVFALSVPEKRFTRAGRTVLTGRLTAHAIDGETGMLVLADGGARIELFDRKAMASAAVLELPAAERITSIAAGAGFAYAGTEKGRVYVVDLAAREVGDHFGAGGPGETKLALSRTGRFLAVVAQDRVGIRPPWPTNLKVFVVDGPRLLDAGTAFLRTRGEAIDVAIIESPETVVVSTTWDLLKWRFPPR